MPQRRRLRKSEEALVVPTVSAALEAAQPHLDALERIIIDQIAAAVGSDLAGVAGLRFLDGVGTALWMSGELAGILSPPDHPG